jgi:hypothetical protein
MTMTDAELADAIWPIYQRYVGHLNTEDTRASFRADVHAVIGSDGEHQIFVCDGTNNPPNVIAANGLGFDLFFKRDGKSLQLSSADLIRAHLADLI